MMRKYPHMKKPNVLWYKIGLLFVLIIIVALASAGLWQRERIKNLESQIKQNIYQASQYKAPQANQPASTASCEPIRGELRVGKAILSYQQNQNVQVYYEKDAGTPAEVLFESVPIGIAGGSVPVFSTTTEPEIVLLKTGDADMGWQYFNQYYIDVTSGKAVSVNSRLENGTTSFEVGGTGLNKTQIELNIKNPCIYSGELSQFHCTTPTSTLLGLDVNGKKIPLQKSLAMSCGDTPENFCYDPRPKFNFLGINKDLTKVFFGVMSSYAGFEGSNIQGLFSLDVKSGAVSSISSNDFVSNRDAMISNFPVKFYGTEGAWKNYSNKNIGFSIQIPKMWNMDDTTNDLVILDNVKEGGAARGGMPDGAIKMDIQWVSGSLDESVNCTEKSEGTVQISCGDVVINGVTFRKKISHSDIEGGHHEIIIAAKKGDRIFTATSFIPFGPSQEAGIQIVNKMFNSLKF
jgi:hypothetical protein